MNYNGLLMQYIGGNVLFCSDDGAIIDWLSQFNYSRQFLRQDGTNTVVLPRESVLDLVIVNNFQKEGEKGLTVGVWLGFVGQQTDLRYLGRPYDKAHEAQYMDIWQNIAVQIQAIGQRIELQSIAFVPHIGPNCGPHFRYFYHNDLKEII